MPRSSRCARIARARACAFLRVGARAQFVEDDQRAVIGLFQDAHDVGQVAAEGAERLLDGLLVADVGPDGFEAGQLGAALGRDVQARLRHERQQPDGFERDGFAAGVWAGDDQRADTPGSRSMVMGTTVAGSSRGWRAFNKLIDFRRLRF